MFCLRNLITKESHLVNGLVNKRLSSNASLFDVKVNDKTGVALVTMQKAPVNSMNLEFLKGLTSTIDDLSSNKSRGMVLTSGLPTIFSGGLDIMEMYKPKPDRLQEFWISLQDCWFKLYGAPFPTAAAINGHSPAGGCLMAMCCEYRVMVDGKSTIGLNETALGIVAPRFFQNTMLNTISPRDTERALTTGTLFSVNEALKIGLIDEIATDKDEAITKCENFIAKFKKINPQARTMSKLIYRGPALKELEDTRDEDLQRFLFAVTNPKVQESIGLYLEALKNKK